MPTIKDVARHAKVSYTTVSHVINKTRFVSEDVVKRVNEAIKKLGYRPNQVARSLRLQESKTIGIISSLNNDQYFTGLLTGIEKEAYKAGYNIIVCYSELDIDKERKNITMLIDKGVDGIISNCTMDIKNIEELQKLKIPVLFLQHHIDNINMDSICTDDELGGYIATKHLIELGHKKIACIAGYGFDHYSYKQRAIGWQKALREDSIEINDEYFIETEFNYLSGYKEMKKIMALKNPPTGIFFYNDNMAIGGMRAASDLGINIPGDVSIVGYDNLEISDYYTPRLTTIDQPKEELGTKAFSRIFERLLDNKIKTCNQVIIPGIICRESTRSI